MNSRYLLVSALLMMALKGYSQTDALASPDDSVYKDETLQEVKVIARKAGTTRLAGAINGIAVNKDELFKAACCNLGESFTTNPSVDVAYTDATTGAKQIKLLGLSGKYVQMLTENLPNFRGAAIPYALGYVPGPWMKGIQVSKGSASVKNGYESITGQINVDYLQPEDEQQVEANVFADTNSRIEVNADANIHLSKGLATEILLHHENMFKMHDDNGDGFYDMPGKEQYNLQNRWVYKDNRYIFHGGLGILKEIRKGGQDKTHASYDEWYDEIYGNNGVYKISHHTNRYEGYMKHAFILNPEHGTNIALMGSASLHQLDAQYGEKLYDVDERNAYGSLMFETNFNSHHNLSVGLSINHDYLDQFTNVNVHATWGYVGFTGYVFSKKMKVIEKETTSGGYAQYTYTLGSKLTAMAGVRFDHSSENGNFFTPRFHVKYSPIDAVSFRLSAGKGYRSVFPMAEYNNLFASGRYVLQRTDELQEEAWNYGVSAAFNIPLFGKNLKLNTEYYYTDFRKQVVVDYDSDSEKIYIYNLCDIDGKSYSHTFQIDASYPILKGLELTAAYRLNDVKCTYGYGSGKEKLLKTKPLTSRYKALVTASYKTPLGLWQFDATYQLNGGGRKPNPYKLEDGTMSWDANFHSFDQASLQITRWFRHWSIYVGGENLTNFKQKHPIYDSFRPWGKDFEPTLVWGPVEGRMFYAGVRVKF